MTILKPIYCDIDMDYYYHIIYIHISYIMYIYYILCIIYYIYHVFYSGLKQGNTVLIPQDTLLDEPTPEKLATEKVSWFVVQTLQKSRVMSP